MKALTLLRTLLLLGAFGFIVLVIQAYRSAIAHAGAIAYGRDVRQVATIDARLNEELLRSRSGLVTHYDVLVRNVKELRGLLRGLALFPSFLDRAAVEELTRRRARLDELVDEKESLVESFKSHNSVLRNSQRFLPVLAAAIGGRADLSPDEDRKLHLLLSTLMRLESGRDREAGPELRAAMDQIALFAPAKDGGEEIEVLLRHAAVVADHKAVLDSLVDRILALPLSGAAAELEDAYSLSYRAALVAEDKLQRILFAVAAAVVVLGLTEVIMRLRQGRTALERATVSLRAVNQELALEREKERQLGELKTRFVSMVSHEFRNPVAAILSSSELLERYGERWDGGRRTEHFETIRAGAANLRHLLDEILLIGRGEAGLLQSHPGPVNLEHLCDELLRTLRQTLGEGHRVRSTFFGDTEVVIDERLMGHLLSNLLENAIKYSPDGSEVELCIDARGPEIRVMVKDRGIGIPAADLPVLFTTFRRGGNVGRVTGSGLGLAVVKHVVQAQGGKVDVKSEVGQGTEIVVVLPRPPLDAQDGVRPDGEARAPS